MRAARTKGLGMSEDAESVGAKAIQRSMDALGATNESSENSAQRRLRVSRREILLSGWHKKSLQRAVCLLQLVASSVGILYLPT